MERQRDLRWAEFGLKTAGWLALAAMAWLFPYVWLDEPIEFLVPSLLLVAGLHLGFFEPTRLPSPRSGAIKKGVAFAFIGASIWSALPPPPEAQMPWREYSEEALIAAREAGRPVLIYFHADWCPPCQAMDRKVFSRKRVVDAAREFVALQADLSDTNSPAAVRIAERHQIYLFPTVAFIGADGRERLNLRLFAFESADAFLLRIQAAGQVVSPAH